MLVRSQSLWFENFVEVSQNDTVEMNSLAFINVACSGAAVTNRNQTRKDNDSIPFRCEFHKCE